MSQASSSGWGPRGASQALARAQLRRRAVAQAGEAQPLSVVLAAVVDEVTSIPLIPCPYCKDVRVVAVTTVNSQKNLGRRFFNCPRNYPKVPNSCRMYMFEDAYEAYLHSEGWFGSTMLMDGVPELVQEIKHLRRGFEDMKDSVE